MASPDVVVIGAGIIGAACAHALRRGGLRVEVVERDAPACATTASGEGNVLVSDKAPGPELALARESRRRWPEVLAELEVDAEWEAKGGLTVVTAEPAGLLAFAQAQRAGGVVAEVADDPWTLEPHLTRAVTAAVHYPEDAQLQPVLAATALLRGIPVRAHTTVTGLGPGILHTTGGPIRCHSVVNASGPWAGEVSAALGAPIAIHPRRGVVLVTSPQPELVRHKVYDGDYVNAVASDDAGLQTSTVVESTRAGTILIGSSRERVGFRPSLDTRVLSTLAAKAQALFPVLATVPVMRAYGGFRPYAPDHLPVIGQDPRLPHLWHATGHEGAGIGLAPATGDLLAALLLGTTPRLDPAPFQVDRPGVLVTA
ncbi:glycine/D-amino acid oxidase-like deaminating enzyme [Crossiella equi]|uniref:Glycine/D-amino acid oxidase-like deaminating enzyme n=1 Tax=Crossiella equi TaxID=130796 RepID=A0ABS5ANF2_9PSEU|nr:FAD-dependent oxidoreductase [Crossiella equi]MBP2478108.1 glycine/D-amino acid oxidase-like deaminating enzyme [Crossiella equi]